MARPPHFGLLRSDILREVDAPAIPTLLIDTSTLLRLQLDRFSPGRRTTAREAAALECLVLFDRVLLDGPTIRANRDRLLWTTDIGAGVEILDLEPPNVAGLYVRGAELFAQMRRGSLGGVLPRGQIPPELSREFPPAHFNPSTDWQDVAAFLEGNPETRPVLHAFVSAHGERPRHVSRGPLMLMRLFYYLALQESAASALLLDPAKAYDEAPRYGQASRLLDVFSTEVRTGYQQRKQRWLGVPQPSMPTPLLTTFVKATAEERDWSTGRVVAWLREQPEVFSFRAGMAALLDAAEQGDAHATDAIMGELEEAAAQWSSRLGTPVNRRTIPITVALPFLEGKFEVPLPALSRTPGAKLLVFIDMLLGKEHRQPPT
ncbi:hypothetical protein [Jidongwangia harbinensis]|uniref:hypothetical protein n=1 Tax=Jidongwangia harbinensis TaxID=2878561 RepID=UPI001CDA53D8|nr:hypothetical protein [Jidongwangia harbinensis]MCA2216035.1 hypothetical protein [Jidongwangia harbinensis]